MVQPITGHVAGAANVTVAAQPVSLWLVLAALFVLTGCVTQTDSSLRGKANESRAEAAYVKLGLAYIGERNLSEARDNLRRALKINPSSAPAMAAEGLIFQMQGEYESAEKSFRKALDFDADFTRGRTYYGAFLYSERRYEEAYEQFRQASRDVDFPDRAQVFYNLALCASRLERDDVALAAYQQSLNIQGDTFEVLSEMAALLLYTGRYPEAARYYGRLDGLVAASPRIQHTPRSLYTGLRLARHQQNRNREASLALLLRNRYPESSEYQQYKALTADD